MNHRNLTPIALITLILLALLPITPSHAQDGGDDDQPDLPPMTQHTLDFDGHTYTYHVFLPSAYDEETALPLLVGLHPAGSAGVPFANTTQMNVNAERDGVIMVYPDGPGGYWDYGYGLPEWEEMGAVRDDPGMFAALLDQLIEDYAVDESNIYIAGHSNGARFAFHLACQYHERLAGAAAVAATISEDIVNACPEDADIPIFYMHGTDDMVTPWEGKPLYDAAGNQITTAWSAPNTVNFWVERNQCETEPDISDLPDLNPDDNVSVRRVLFSGCAEDSEVWFGAVLAGGHGWLGQIPNLVPEGYQPSGSATEYMWAFFGLGEAE